MVDESNDVDGGVPDPTADGVTSDIGSHVGADGFWYPTVDDIVEIHDDIIDEDPAGEPGIRNQERIQYAIDYIRHGMFGEKPESVHEKAFALIRLLASNHWFVDGNKRTALNTTNLFYLLNGYELEYGDDLRSMLKLLAVRENLIDRDVATGYLADQTEEIDESAMIALGLMAIGSILAEDLEIDLGGLNTESPHDESDPHNHND